MNSYKKGNDEDNPQFIFLEKIKAMLITIIEKERINNQMKINLSNFQNLNIINYFTEIDSNQKDFIDINDLKKYLELNSISYNEKIIRRFIRLFDKHNNFYLIYDDFYKIFSPYTMENDYNNISIMKEKELIINILCSYFELIEQINEMIINIRNTNNFTTYEAFMGITKGNKYLDEEFLIHFLEHNYNSNEVKNLMYLIDSNNDSLISYEEFQNFFIPFIENNIEEEDLNKNDDIENNKINNENNDIVNFEKSGKYRKNINHEKNADNSYNRINEDNNNENNENLNEDNNFENKENNQDDKINENDNLEQSDNNLKNSNMNINELKNSAEINNDNINNNNNLNSSQEEIKKKNLDDNNNNYEINISSDDDYDNYCNFYRKTKKFLSTSTKKNNQINNNINSSNNNLSQKENNNSNNIKQTKNNELNINHSEMQYLPNNIKENLNNEFTIVKNGDITLSEKDKNNFNIYNTAEKEKNLNSINNFTCGKKNENNINNSSSKKINLNINSNDLENYSLSNEYNNINNNLISKDTNYDKNITSDDNMRISNKENNIKINISEAKENNKITSSDKEIIINEKINTNNQNNRREEIINLSNSSLSNFIKYIQYLLLKEKHTIDLKDKLSLREDISLKDLFCIFDYNKKNLISKKEFKVVCKKIFGLYPTSDQVTLVYKRYDKDKDDNLNLKEFLDMIKPLKEEYACFLFNKKKKVGINSLNIKSKKMFIDVLRAIIEDEGYYYRFMDDLDNQNLFDLKEFWNIINQNENKEGFDKLEMYNFLTENGCTLSQYDIDIIFNKIDHDKDDIISYDDLTQEFINYY
jgi:Ca2+-binding EF-hand superfamily protein